MNKQADVTNCDDLNCKICVDQVETYGIMKDNEAKRKMVAYNETKNIAAQLYKMQRGY